MARQTLRKTRKNNKSLIKNAKSWFANIVLAVAQTTEKQHAQI